MKKLRIITMVCSELVGAFATFDWVIGNVSTQRLQ